MTTSVRTSTSAATHSTAALLRPLTTIGLGALILNLIPWGMGRIVGVDFVVAPPGDGTMVVGPISIGVMTLLPVAVGGVLTALAARRRPRVVSALAWIGLAIGIITLPMPYAVQASSGTHLVLASMHLITGLVWWATLRRVVSR